MDDAPGWEGILDPGERLLWQGRPDATLDLSPRSLRRAAFGLPLLGFGLLWLALTRGAVREEPVIGWLFPLIGVGVAVLGLWRVAGATLWDAWVRSHTWYTLSDRRAFVATQIMGQRRLHAFSITRGTLLDYDGAQPGTIWFAQGQDRGAGNGIGRKRHGFRRIPDALAVHGLMRAVQRQATGDKETR